MSDFLSRLAERAQGRTQVAEPLIPSRFAASPWPTAGDPATPVREEYLERGPVSASDRKGPLPEPQAPTEPGTEPNPPVFREFRDGVEAARHSSVGFGEQANIAREMPPGEPAGPAQDLSSPNPGTHPSEGPGRLSSPSVPATTPVPPYTASGSEGAAEGQPTSPSLPHAEASPIERETKGEVYGTESRRSMPESSKKPPSASHTGAEYIDKLPPSKSQEQNPDVPNQHGRGEDSAERRISPAVESGHGEAGPALPGTEKRGLQEGSRQGLPTRPTEPPTSSRMAPESAPEQEEARTSAGARRVADRVLSRGAVRRHGTGIGKPPYDLEGYELSGVEVPRIPSLREVPEEDSAPTDGGLPSIDPRPLRGERVGGQSPEPFAREPSWSQVPWVEQVEGRRSTQPPPSPPSVRVIIGRVEVRAVQPPEPPEARSPNGPRSPRLTLDDYLKERSGGGS
jgi:hypothetical protein